MKKIRFVAPLIAVLLFAGVSIPAHAAQLTEAQISAIIGLLQSFGADSGTIQNVNATLRGQATTGSATSSVCVDLLYNLYSDRTDATTNGEVTKLQQFLANNPSIYPSGLVTGYFGPMTEGAVQAWQSAHGIVSSGSPDTTGYGYVGPKTRAAMSCGSGSTGTSTNVPVKNEEQKELTVDLKINDSDGPIAKIPGYSIFRWTSSNADYCTALGDIYWTGKKSTSGSLGIWTGNEKTGVTTYQIVCGTSSGEIKSVSDSITVTFLKAPTVDLKIDSSDGPLTKASGYSTFSWTSSNADYCTASGDTNWSGSKPTSGSETVWTSNEKTGVTVYKLTCGPSSGKVDSASDAITITFQY